MGARGHDGLTIPGRVVLAREQPVSIGPLQFEPKLRQVRIGNADFTLEPRVMQVLVALARARGEIVTRDELADYCWDGRAVGDDSINRVLSRIRRIAGETAGGAFRLETIPRVGYRLLPAETKDRSAAPKQLDTAAHAAIDRRALLIGAGASLTAGAGAVLLMRRPWRDPIPHEARLLYEQADAMNSVATRMTGAMAIPYLEEAVRIAPEFGEAWGALALEYRAKIESDPGERPEYEPRLREAVAKAKRYSPGNPDAEAAIVFPGEHFGRWGAIEPAYRRLVSRHPNYALGHHLLGALLMDVGRWSDAIDELRAARRLEPSSPIPAYKLTVALWSAGRLSEAEQEIAAAMRRWPRHSAIWQTKIKLLMLTGRPGAALQMLNDPSGEPLDYVGDFAVSMRFVATALLTRKANDIAAATAAIERNGPRVAGAIYCAALGNNPLALDMLDGVFRGLGRWASPPDPAQSATHPLFQPPARALWRQPRFSGLLTAIGLERYWRASGTEPDYRRFS
jgi:DNA-binding winged helix-turn-helix (wHTH) protein